MRFQLKIDEVEQVTCVYSPDLPLVRKEDEDLIRLGNQSIVQLMGRGDCRFIVKERYSNILKVGWTALGHCHILDLKKGSVHKKN